MDGKEAELFWKHNSPTQVRATDHSTRESETLQVDASRYEHHPAQTVVEDKDSMFRVEVQEVENHNKDLQARLARAGVLAAENARLKMELDLLGPYKSGFDAMKIEMQSLQSSQRLLEIDANSLRNTNVNETLRVYERTNGPDATGSKRRKGET